MTRIAVNAALDIVRRRPGHAPVHADVAAVGSDPTEDVLRRDQQRRVHQAIVGLPPDHRAVVVLRDVQGLRYEEIARVLKVPAGTVRSRLSRARESLRIALADLAPRAHESEGAGRS
jgi:RNA polymerase sigma-70 factor (ECF subfamily)